MLKGNLGSEWASRSFACLVYWGTSETKLISLVFLTAWWMNGYSRNEVNITKQAETYICRKSYSMWRVTSVHSISWHDGKQTLDNRTSGEEKSTITQRYIRCQHDYVGFLAVGPVCEARQKAVWITVARMQLTCIIHLFSSFYTGLSSTSQNFILSL
jgi:hypothetical protein